MDNPRVMNLSDPINKTIDGINNFYQLIDIAKVNKEKLNTKFLSKFSRLFLELFKKNIKII